MCHTIVDRLNFSEINKLHLPFEKLLGVSGDNQIMVFLLTEFYCLVMTILKPGERLIVYKYNANELLEKIEGLCMAIMKHYINKVLY